MTKVCQWKECTYGSAIDLLGLSLVAEHSQKSESIVVVAAVDALAVLVVAAARLHVDVHVVVEHANKAALAKSGTTTAEKIKKIKFII